MPPSKRRTMSCQTCRRLKTRCEVIPGCRQCLRCQNLRLECTLPFASRVKQKILSQPASSSNNNNALNMEKQPAAKQECCSCHERLARIESTLAEIATLLRCKDSSSSCSAPLAEKVDESQEDHQAPDPPGCDQPEQSPGFHLTTDVDHDGFPRAGTGAVAQIAPIQVVRQLNSMITGVAYGADSGGDILDELLGIGIDPDGLGVILFQGFVQMAAPLQFFKLDFQSLKRHHSLLFAACLLAGIQTTSVLRGSVLHSSLYRSVRDNLGRTMLNTPIELSTIHTMLVFCVWNVAQDFRGRYVDNWFLSGSALLHLLLVLDFRSINHIDCAGDLQVRVQAQEGLRTWTLACVLHIKYSIGTGQPLVIDISLMERLVSVMQRAETEADSLEETSTAELQLYILLYKIVVQKEDNSTSTERTWESIEAWSKKHNKDNTPDLKLAYSSISLILARWDLTRQSSSADTTNNIVILRLINQAIYHSHQILEQMMHPHRAPSYVHQTYNTLLRAYAGVTLVEYGVHLPDIQGTFRLMERVLRCPAQEERLVEPVFQWATNVMRKRALDAIHCSVEVDDQQLAAGGDDASSPDWTRHFLVDAMFPFN